MFIKLQAIMIRLDIIQIDLVHTKLVMMKAIDVLAHHYDTICLNWKYRPHS